MNNFSRATSAFVLTASLFISSVAALAQTPATKPADDAQKTTQTQSDQKAPANQNQAEQKKTVPAPVPAPVVKSSGKPLSTNEDPSQIGKRNINTGIIAKMSGSTEKEVRLGRELAAEVDRYQVAAADRGVARHAGVSRPARSGREGVAAGPETAAAAGFLARRRLAPD